MIVILNGKQEEIKEKTTLLDIINEKKIETLGVAIAVNNIVISKNKWQETILKSNDKILVVTATHGG